jgi:GTPase SAR1 family protein
MSYPDIKPIKLTSFEVTQSKYSHVSKLPTRSLILGPSGSGKTILLQSMILDIYRNCFSRIYMFSPSIHVDHTWRPVIEYIRNNLKQDNDKEKYLFDDYNPSELDNIIQTQHKLVNYMKDNHYKTIYQIMIIIDDFADTPEFTRSSKLLHSLYIRGRHTMISTVTASQVYKLISPVIRKNITALYIFRLRNHNDLEAWVEELSAIYDKNILLNLYHMATEPDYGFLYIDLVATNKRDMFYLNLKQKLIPN